LVLVPFSYGAMWYWHDRDGVNIWYPSLEVVRSSLGNDWSDAIEYARRLIANI